MKKVNHWINGKNVAGNDYFQTTNPATGEVLADVNRIRFNGTYWPESNGTSS